MNKSNEVSAQHAAHAKHLSEGQIDAVLLGDAQAASVAHLETCAQCRSRMAELAGPMADFAAATLAWGERRSATLPPPALTASAPWSRRANWAVGAVALLVAGLLLPTVGHRAASPKTSAAAPVLSAKQAAPVLTASTATMQPSLPSVKPALTQTVVARASAAPALPGHNNSAEMDRDNRMLEAIDDAWDAAPPSPAESFGFRPASGSSSGGHYVPL